MAIDSVQGAFRRAKFKAGIAKKRVSVHTLRHYAEYGIMSSNPRNPPCFLGTSPVQLGIILMCFPPHTLGNRPAKEEKHAELILRILRTSAAIACIVIGSKHRRTVCIAGQYGFGPSTRQRGIAFWAFQTVSGYAE
jgi:hypothetical protein